MKTRTPLSITVFALLAAALPVRVLAQQPGAPAPAQAQPAPADQPTPPAAPPAEGAALADKPAAADAAAGSATRARDAAGRETLSVDFPDEDIRNILRNVADLFELNIIMPETLQGKTTIKLRDVTWRQIFQNVLQPVGYTYIEDGNIIKIVSNDSLQQEPVATEVFIVNYARAADIMPTVSSLVDAAAGGKIVVDARTNSLVITERPSRMNRVRPIIEQLDRATDQVMIESKFVEVTDRDVKNIGINWSSLANYNVGVGNIGGDFNRTRGQNRDSTVNASSNATRTTTLDGSDTSGATGNNNQTSGSTNTGAVTSTAGVPSSTSSTGSSGALDSTSTSNFANTLATTVAETAANSLNSLLNVANTGTTNRSATAVFTADEFNLVLSALNTTNNVKIISNPTIVTLNNSEASINVGSETPIPNYTYNQERGSFEVSGFTWKQIGILLKVTPQVNGAGMIKLTLAPEVSQQNGSTTFGGAGGASLPIVATRKALTSISIKDGYTMGIGGLLTTQSTNGQNKVPVVGSIPVLGRLFKHDTKESSVTNLIIFVTAKTLSAAGAPTEQIFESSRVRQLDIRREDLPGYRDGSSPYTDGLTLPAVHRAGAVVSPEARK